MPRIIPLLCASLTLATLVPATSSAQHAATRRGFWFNAGLGVASYGCEGCDGRESGGGGSLSLGGTLSQHLNVGVGVNVWAKEVGGVDLLASTITAMVRLYPSATGGFYLTGGVGQGSLRASQSGVAITESGLGLLLGLGYDIRVGRNISLTPFWHGNALSVDGSTANFGQLGIGVTVH